MTKPPVDAEGSALVETLRLTNIADRRETGKPRDGSGSYLIRTRRGNVIRLHALYALLGFPGNSRCPCWATSNIR
jgi:hypothetical protein